MHSFNNILIPTDFSPAAWNATQFALSLIKTAGSRLTLLHVFAHSAKFSSKKTHLNSSDLKTLGNIKDQMDEFCRELEVMTSGDVHAVILSGGVEKEIVKFVEKNPFDLIIMGVNSNGLDNQPGSHLNNIIEKVNAPVLIIPNKLMKVPEAPVKVNKFA